jgi:uncharacterized membrane protein YagU involved in acid resistance
MVKAVVFGAAAGLVAITVYLSLMLAIQTHAPPTITLLRLLQWDASNAYGASAFGGGWPMAILGFAMDIVVSLCWASAFCVLYARVEQVRRAPALFGLVFGAVVMFVMLFLIVPLGHAQQASHKLVPLLNTLVAHTVFFGLPLALVIHALSRQRPSFYR